VVIAKLIGTNHGLETSLRSKALNKKKMLKCKLDVETKVDIKNMIIGNLFLMSL